MRHARAVRALWVTVEQDFSAPVDRVFAHLSEHENLAEVFGAKVERLEDGQPERNGVGSRRRDADRAHRAVRGDHHALRARAS